MENLPERIEDFEKRSERFLEELCEEYYRTFAGLKDRSNLSAIYDRHKDLVAPEICEEIRELLISSSGENERRLRFLLSFATHLIVGDAAKEIDDERNNLAANAKVHLPWGEESYRLSAVLLQNEPDPERRKIIDDSRREVHRQLTPIISRLLKTTYEAFQRLGYPEYIKAIEQLERIDLHELRDKMAESLPETEAQHRQALSEAVEKKLGLSLDEVHKRDVTYLFRSPEFDPIFDAERLLPSAEETLNRMGLDLYAGGRIKLNMEKRPKKSPRAFCAPLKVPHEVILVTMPSGGVSDYGSFLHELGHALHFANVAPEAAFEYRWLGDNSVTEGFAMLFGHLLLNPAWLTEYLPAARSEHAAELDDYLKHARLCECHVVRRYAAKIAYELALHDAANTEDKPTLYKKLLGDACLVEYVRDDHLVDLDMHFYCARYLRAWIFEANLASYLEKEFGERWFQKPSAGDFLLDLWKEGQKFTIEELEERLGFSRLDTGPLIQRLIG